jgi:hypothetical protein
MKTLKTAKIKVIEEAAAVTKEFAFKVSFEISVVFILLLNICRVCTLL